MLFGPPDKSQLRGALYSAYQEQPTGGCEEEEVALVRRILLALSVAAYRGRVRPLRARLLELG